MPSTFAESFEAILEPYVGRVVSTVCAKAAAQSVGKSIDLLDVSDMDAVETSIRSFLAPVAPRATIEAIVADCRRITR